MRKIKQAEIEFHGAGVQWIKGLNKAGKSTLAQCVELTLGGSKSFSRGMISGGEAEAEIVAYTDDGLKIRTAVTDCVRQSVSRLDPATGKYAPLSGGVRAFIDSIRSGLEMPWSMREMSDAEIIERLKKRSGVSQKIAEIDAELQEKESARAAVGRNKKRMGEIQAVVETEHPDPVGDIQAERGRAEKYLKKEKAVLEAAADYIKTRCSFTSLAEISGLHADVDEALSTAENKLRNEQRYTRSDLCALEKRLSEWVQTERKAATYDDFLKRKSEYDALSLNLTHNSLKIMI
jgi:hypothetical protein